MYRQIEGKLQRLIISIIGVIGIYVLVANPVDVSAQGVMGQSLTPIEERQAGEELFKQRIQEKGEADQELTDLVQQLVERIATASGERTNLKFRAVVVNDNTYNAEALPGGHIVVNSGLIAITWEKAKGNAKKFEGFVAAVIAHEVAHVMHRDTDALARIYFRHPDASWANLEEQIQKEGGKIALEQWLAQKRQREDDADRDGMWYLVRAGYPSQYMVDEAKLMVELGDPSFLGTRERTHSRSSDRFANLTVYQGKIFSLQSKYDEAILTLQLGLQDDSLDKAVKDLEDTKEFFPLSVPVRHALGVAYHRMYLRTVTPAQLVYKPSFAFYKFTALRAKPDIESLLKAVDEYAFILQNFEKDDYKGVDLTVSAYGIALVQVGKVDEGLQWCQKAVELDPNNWHNLNNLGIAYHKKGDIQQASQYYDQAIQAAQKTYNPDILAKLMKGEAMDVSYSELIHAQRILLIEFAPAIYNAAIAARDLKDNEFASMLFNAYLKIDTESAWAEQAKRELQKLQTSPQSTPTIPQPTTPTTPQPTATSQPTKVVGISNIQNGDSVSSVQTVYGKPEGIQYPAEGASILIYKSRGLTFVAVNNIVNSIITATPFNEAIGGLKIGDSASKIIQIFGKPLSQQDMGHGIVLWDYSPWGVKYGAQKDLIVGAIIVGQPESPKPKPTQPASPTTSTSSETEKLRHAVSFGVLPGDSTEYVQQKLGSPSASDKIGETIWNYSSRGVLIIFNESEEVSLVGIYGTQEHFANIKVGTNIANVIQGLGDPHKIWTNDDGSKSYVYVFVGGVGVGFFVQNQRITKIVIARID